jgi:transposase
MTIHDEAYHRTANRIEAKLARHWPELTTILDLGSATLLALLEKYGGPRAVQEDPAGVRVHLRQAGRQFWSADKIEQVIASATTTLGMPMMAAEEKALRTLAEEANRQRKAKKAAERDVARCAQAKPVVQHMASTVGTATATVLVTTVGAPEDYPNAHSYLKAFGLNLKERSSGKCQGQLKITKRGPAQARRYLYLAALRLIQKKRGDKVVRAWYLRKVMRDGGRYKKKAVVALMRKLALALWHVGQGEVFDSHRLFDARRLKTAEQIALAA